MMKAQNLHHKICLVTGGAGFIGSHLCEKLLSDEYIVYCVDNLLTGKVENIKHLINRSCFHFVNHDISLSLPDLPDPQFIFHLASPASPKWYQRYPIETLLVNTHGTYLLVEKARASGGILLFASSSEVYGEPEVHPQKESYRGNVSTTGPRSCYDEGKRCGEAYVASAISAYKIDGRIIRIFNTYGPRMQADDGRVVSNFVSQALSGSPLTANGDGTQTRSFCYVSDLVDGISKMMFTKEARGQIINLGNDQEISILSLIEELSTILKKKLEISYQPLPLDDPSRRRPDLTLARKVLKWEPQISLNVGLAKTIAYEQSKT